jgi:Uncharacterised protein family (UPF0203)
MSASSFFCCRSTSITLAFPLSSLITRISFRRLLPSAVVPRVSYQGYPREVVNKLDAACLLFVGSHCLKSLKEACRCSSMGSSQSSPPSHQALPDPASTMQKDIVNNQSTNQTDNGADGSSRIKPSSKSKNDKSADDKAKSLSGMDLVHYKCRRKHKAYQTCIKKWYKGEFLEAKSLDQDEVCGESFERYRKCVLKGIRKEIFDKQGKKKDAKRGGKTTRLDYLSTFLLPLNTHLFFAAGGAGLRPPLPDSPLGELEDEETKAAHPGLDPKP